MSPKLSLQDACGGAASHHPRSRPEPASTCRALAARLVLIFDASPTLHDLDDALETLEFMRHVVIADHHRRQLEMDGETSSLPLNLRLSE